ncbi:hypothetical protein JTB14_009777 [Gonioctena quinquepunctata]|nr:hypothetical protein JTB14_009777 [Gonioctena quinquepunctata]
MQQETFEDIYTNNNIQQTADHISHVIMKNINESTTIKTTEDKHKKKPWITKGLIKSMKERDKLFKLFKMNKDTHLYNEYKIHRNKIVKLISELKQNYYKNIIMKNSKNSKKIWQTVNEYANRNVTQVGNNITEILNENNEIEKDLTNIVDIFNEHYATVVNLSIADTMVSIGNVTFNFWYMLFAHWPFGSTYCKITQFVAALSICSSIYSLLSISVDRYIALLTPLRPRMGKKITLVLALATWILGAAVGMPDILYFQSTPLNGTDRIMCYMKWPDGEENQSKFSIIYNICFTVITYLIPIGAMIFTYTRIGMELWGSQSIGEITERQKKNIQSKRKVVKMMMIIVIIFAVCWLPYHIYFFVTFYFPSVTERQYIQEVYLFIYWLAMSNSMYNPMIYCWMNARFRTGFKKIFTCLPFITLSPSQTLTDRDLSTCTKRSYLHYGTPEQKRISRKDVRMLY